MARIITENEAGGWVPMVIPTPTGSVARGDILRVGHLIVYVFADPGAYPEEQPGVLELRVLEDFGHETVVVLHDSTAHIIEASTGPGSVTFAQGARVYYDFSARALAPTDSGGAVLLGYALSAKTVEDSSFGLYFSPQ